MIEAAAGRRLAARSFPAPSRAAAELAVRTLLAWVGDDPARDGLLDTPRRVVDALRDMTAGLDDPDPARHLARVFEAEHAGVVVVRGIRFTSLCEHHLLPFVGTAAIAYVPGEGRGIVGVSKLVRTFMAYARRPQVQERLGDQTATTIADALGAMGVAVVIRAHHQCMGCRGVLQPDAEMVTSTLLGAFREQGPARAEVLALIRGE